MNDLLAYFDARLALQSLQIGAGLLMALTATEILLRFGLYAKAGILTWEIGRRAGHIYQSPLLRRMGDFFYQDQRFRALFALRVGLGLGMLICGILAIFSPILIGLALLSSLLVLYRAGSGHDGSFQLRILILFVLFTCSISPWGSLPFRLGLYFLSAQLILSYLLAGIAKIRGLSWRNGTALVGIFGTVYHGTGWVYRLLASRPGLSQALSWFVIAFEILFPLVLIGNAWILLIFLSITTLFHLLTSFLMGLNGFFLSFVAAYPTLVFCLVEVG